MSLTDLFKRKDLQEKLTKEKRQAEERDAQRRAAELKLPYLNLISVEVPTEIKAMALVPEDIAKQALFCPLQLIQNKLAIAVFDPRLPATKEVLENLKKNFEIKIYISSRSSLAHAWTYYKYIKPIRTEITSQVEISEENLKKIQTSVKNLEELSKLFADITQLLTSQILEIILGGALALRASDIHLEAGAETGVFRLRIDGLLHTILNRINLKTYNSLIERIKLLSNLKLNITDQAQDGRFTIKLSDREIEIRTSIIPSEYGETAVLRLLDPASLKVNLEELGWRTDDLEIVKQEIQKPNGLILNTGPTGSGKTTTLYAFLKKLYRPEIKIITIEDPVEYHLPGISQTQVNPEANYTFANGLRSILRQDPNVVLVGEIRDKETAEIALNASLTGHIVFSTLHTNDAIGAVPRLIDLGAKPQILGAALSLVIAQRLVRLLCPVCKKELLIDAALKEKIQKFVGQLPSRVNKTNLQNFKIFEPTGCSECGGLGYRGRTSIFELFVINEIIEEAIYQDPSELNLKKLARQQGMVYMQEDGLIKVLLGLTTFTEVERVTGPLNL